MNQTLIFYGNCQMGEVAKSLKGIDVLADVTIAYYASFDRPLEDTAEEATIEEISSCTLWIGHPDEPLRPFPSRLLPSNCVRVIMPPVDSNLHWPFHILNPFDVRNRQYPWGRFPFGDRVVAACIERGLTPTETVAYYLTQWEAYKPNLDRLYQMEAARIVTRDVACDVKLAPLILNTIRSSRLLNSPQHPTTILYRELLGRALHLIKSIAPELRRIDLTSLMDSMNGLDPWPRSQLPIHPRVAQHFSIEWWHADMIYRFIDGEYTHDSYIEALATWSYDVKNGSSVR